ncbi:sugar kinase [Streptomyces sp. CC77]|uniref:sugar kinase n=1 Tax=Streptomyces sp. CC77 TaxID=1906739 RepID=UPI0008DE6AD4|nr:sugar kinase [Streptomyces sp. CC77]OII70618.1 carbohydrate kinase [Streptomyces sp. CC77]
MVPDAVCLGEAMTAFLPSRPGPLADVPSFTRSVGGAEANTACALADAGHRVRWVGRVGADAFGDHVVAALTARGVDVSAVQRDPHRPTGIYFRTATDRSAPGHEVVYHRAGSAASALGPHTADRDAVHAGRVLHLTGVTAALSADCLALMRDLTARRPGRPLLSFDVNHRPALWRHADAGPVLLDLARGADLVFVGHDEARALWGLHGARAVRQALPEPDVLVVKLGPGGAVVFHPDPDGSVGCGGGVVTVERPPRVDCVDATGAGDAFAAGFLSAVLRGLPVRDRLRHGHLRAAAALTEPGDLAARLDPVHADRLVALDDGAWGRLRLGPGWTRRPPGAAQDHRAGQAREAGQAQEARQTQEARRTPGARAARESPQSREARAAQEGHTR